MASLLIKFHSQQHLYETHLICFHQTRSQVSELRIGSARNAATSPDNDDMALSSAFMKRIKPFDPDIAGSKPKPGSGTGILFRKQSTPMRRLASTCTE